MNSRILGFDPGVKVSGYGVIQKCEEGKLVAVDYGIIKNTFPDSFPLYLEKVYDSIVRIMRKFSPSCIAIEEPFVARNPHVGLKIGKVFGVASLAGTKEGLEVFSYSTLEIKQAVTGYGRAEKSQVQDMMKRMLSLKEDFKHADTADALAAAVCCMNSRDWEKKIEKS